MTTMRFLAVAVASCAYLASPPRASAFAPRAARARGLVRLPLCNGDLGGNVRLQSSAAAAAAVDTDEAAAGAAAGASAGAATGRQFTSPAFRVYIEDTDAYGVVYNGNYVRSYERALSHVPRSSDDEGGEGEGGGGGGGRWILTSVTDHRFRSSPSLGEEYVVRGELVDELSRNEEEVWRLEMVTRNNNNNNNNGSEGENGADEWTVHNSATATIVRSTRNSARVTSVQSDIIASPSSPEEPRSDTGEATVELGKMFEHSFTPYHDEFDAHHHLHEGGGGERSYHIPIRSALNFFERSRTSYLGGPDALRRMQVEDDLLWVVTAIDDGELLLDSVVLEHDGDEGSSEGGAKGIVHPAPGREVVVRTNFVPKRRGMIVECHHRLYAGSPEGGGGGKSRRRRLLAKAKVTVMALRGSTRRPTSKLPPWVLDMIM